MEWWQVAAENGNTSALIKLGDAYRFGEKVQENLGNAEQYYQRALSSGLEDGETSLGYLYGTYAARAKKKGDVKASEQANEKRFTYFQNSAQKGSSGGMHQLAHMYHYGDYVKADLQKAIQWYEKSSSAGNSDAAETLAKLYVDEDKMGKGKSKPDMAAKYFRLAIQLGSKTAGVELAELIKNNKDIFKTADEAIKLYEQALSGGSLRAASVLSELYMKGELVTKDFKKAEQYALKVLELKPTIKPDSEDAYPMYIRQASFNLLQLYKKEGLQPATPKLVEKLTLQVGPVDGKMKRFTVPVTCGTIASPFHIYIWDSGLDEPPTTDQFTWLEKARGCEVSKDIVESFQKLYKIARDNKVSFQELSVYALGEANKKSEK